uniref:Uncharacterized protein n=1 Tax=Polytomella parva TaxID=51329 RepID=A0A7S0UMR2_9CHLO|mmetsp:Transcript_14661/g.25788  ORF Transcript_14661/g.25788 Transcript_14661/m.25788 type:complete len:100 (+) Transcript_14661:131-430(+)
MLINHDVRSIEKRVGMCPPSIPLMFFNQSSSFLSIDPKLANSDKAVVPTFESKGKGNDTKLFIKDHRIKFNRKWTTSVLAFGSGGFNGYENNYVVWRVW